MRFLPEKSEAKQQPKPAAEHPVQTRGQASCDFVSMGTTTTNSMLSTNNALSEDSKSSSLLHTMSPPVYKHRLDIESGEAATGTTTLNKNVRFERINALISPALKIDNHHRIRTEYTTTTCHDIDIIGNSNSNNNNNAKRDRSFASVSTQGYSDSDNEETAGTLEGKMAQQQEPTTNASNFCFYFLVVVAASALLLTVAAKLCHPKEEVYHNSYDQTQGKQLVVRNNDLEWTLHLLALALVIVLFLGALGYCASYSLDVECCCCCRLTGTNRREEDVEMEDVYVMQ